MKPVVHPPDAVLRAYADLLNQVFLFLRGRSHKKARDQEELFDLADALHNVGGILATMVHGLMTRSIGSFTFVRLIGSGETRAFDWRNSYNPGWMST